MKIQPTAPQRVTRAQYARQLRAAGVKLESDQDVYHIISSENGGADHPDNYHFVQVGTGQPCKKIARICSVVV